MICSVWSLQYLRLSMCSSCQKKKKKIPLLLWPLWCVSLHRVVDYPAKKLRKQTYDIHTYIHITYMFQRTWCVDYHLNRKETWLFCPVLFPLPTTAPPPSLSLLHDCVRDNVPLLRAEFNNLLNNAHCVKAANGSSFFASIVKIAP